MLRYRLQVTRFDAASNNVDVVQNDVFEVPSDNKHGLQRKAIDRVLAEGLRAEFQSPKWTNEDVTIGDDSLTMMHMTAFHADHTKQLKLHQVGDDTEVTFHSTVRQVNSNKAWFIVEIQNVEDGKLTADFQEALQAANLTAAKLRIKDRYSDFDGQYISMPFDNGIYRNHASEQDSVVNTSILVLRPASDEEADELGKEEASE